MEQVFQHAVGSEQDDQPRPLRDGRDEHGQGEEHRPHPPQGHPDPGDAPGQHIGQRQGECCGQQAHLKGVDSGGAEVGHGQHLPDVRLPHEQEHPNQGEQDGEQEEHQQAELQRRRINRTSLHGST